MPVFTPDDLMAGRLPSGKVVLFDDDHYYMGGVLAELCARGGCDVTPVTPSADRRGPFADPRRARELGEPDIGDALPFRRGATVRAP